MANVKISELPVATSVDVVDTVPLVQGGTTKQATQAALLTTTGNVTAAKLVPTGGTATGNGMYLPATNALAWSTNGVEGMRLDASGNLLVGTINAELGSGFGNIQIQGSSGAIVQAQTGAGTVKCAISTDSSSGYVGARTNHPLLLITNNSERARITSGGDFGFGQSPDTNRRFCIRGSGTSNAGFTFAVQNSAPADLFLIRNDGATFFGLAAASPYNLTTGEAANAHLAADGYLYRSTSSRKYKTDIQDATHGLAEVLALRPVTYKGRSSADGDRVFGGLIAEEVHEAGLTEFVQYAPDGSPDALAYGNMVALLAKAIQEQQEVINDLRARVAALEA